MFILVAIFITLLLVLAFVATVRLGRSQKPSQNAEYDQSRMKTLLLLTIIYVITVIGLMGLVYFYILD